MPRPRFNPPPSWPAPPPGWTPPPGWKPDPSWPPAPADWQFWVHPERANRGAWVWALGSAVVLYVVVLVAIGVAGGLTAEGAGGLLPPFVLAGGAVGLFAWLLRSRLPRGLYPVLVFVVAFFLAALSAFGRMSR